jgi:hypothetical protein
MRQLNHGEHLHNIAEQAVPPRVTTTGNSLIADLLYSVYFTLSDGVQGRTGIAQFIRDAL